MKKKSVFFALALTAVLFLLNRIGVIHWSWYLLAGPVWIYLMGWFTSVCLEIRMHDVEEHHKANNGRSWRS